MVPFDYLVIEHNALPIDKSSAVCLNCIGDIAGKQLPMVFGTLILDCLNRSGDRSFGGKHDSFRR